MSKYTPYMNDVIDKYDNLRSAEHTGTMLDDIIDEKSGIVKNNILVTRLELANDLTFLQEFDFTSSKGFDVSTLFAGYGDKDKDGKIRAIRAWSGNDHFLLPIESVKANLYVIPLDKQLNEDNLFNIVYYTKGYDTLVSEIESGEYYKQGHAYLYHDGDTSGGSMRNTTMYTVAPSDKSLIDANAPEVRVPYTEDHVFKDDRNDVITLPQPFENIAHVYLKDAPIHQKFQLAENDKVIPLYGGMLTIVYKDKTTFDISTYTKLSYFYSLKELREYDMPDVLNYNVPFDWEKTGGHNVRHVPLLVVNPNNKEQRIRVLDSFDSNVTMEPREEYSITIGSKTMFEPTLQPYYKVLEMPTKTNISYLDNTIDISGLRVAKVIVGEETKYYSADNGTLYLQNKGIDDSEMCLSNLGNKIERDVYCRVSETVEEKVMTISFPVVEPDASEVISLTNTSGVNEVEGEETNPADHLAKAQASLGCNDTDTTGVSLFQVKRYSQGRNLIVPRECKYRRIDLKELMRKQTFERTGQYNPYLKIIRPPQKSVFLKRIKDNNVAKNAEDDVKICDEQIMFKTHYVPKMPQAQRIRIEQEEALTGKPANLIPWTLIAKGLRMGMRVLNGIGSLKRMFKRKVETGVKKSNIHVVKGFELPMVDKLYAEETVMEVNNKIVPMADDMVITGFDGDSTAPTMTIKVATMGQQQTVVLHHPQAVSRSNKSIIGIIVKQPPMVPETAYGNEDMTEYVSGSKGAKFVAVNSENEEVPLAQGNWLNGSPYLSADNLGLIALPVKYSPAVANGQIEVPVQATAAAIEAYKKMGYTVSSHLITNEYPNGVLNGIFSLVTRIRKFISEHPKVVDIAKRGLSWAAGRLWKRFGPKTVSNGNAEVADEEPDVVTIAPAQTAIEDSTDTGKEIEDDIVKSCVAVAFEGNFPEKTNITVETLQNYFNSARVSTLTDKDEEYLGTSGIGFSRNYMAQGDFNPPNTLGRDLMEFGKAIFTWRGISFELKRGFINVYERPDLHLVMVSPPNQVVYTFGETKADLTGVSFNLVTSSGTVIIEGLTKDNFLVDDLPTNIEEMVLEEPTNPNDKTTLRVYFMGYTNDEIKVSLINPYVTALQDYKKLGHVSLNSANSILSIITKVAPIALNLVSSLFNRRRSNDNATWSPNVFQLLKDLNTKVVMRDNFMRRKVFSVSEMSETLFNKLFTVTGYNPSSSDNAQEITVTCMGHSTKKWITIDQMVYSDEDKMENGDLKTGVEPSTEPPEGFKKDEDDEGGELITLQPDSTDYILKSVYDVYDVHRESTDGVRSIKNLPLLRFFKPGVCRMGFVYSGNNNFNALYTNESTGLRHHMELRGIKDFFKKVWRGVKKVGGKVINGVKKVVKTVANVGKNVVGGLLAGAMGGGGEEEEPAPEGAFYTCIGEDENGTLQFVPMMSSKNGKLHKSLQEIISGVKTVFSRIKNKVVRIYAAGRRLVGAFMNRNPVGTPGLGSYLVGRRFPEVYPSGLAANTNLDGTLADDTTTSFDVLEMVGVSTYDPSMEVKSSTASLSGLSFNCAAFSCQELCLGDTWPTIEEVAQIMNIYVQRTSDRKWVSIPLNHTSIKIQNYSSLTDLSEQKIDIVLSLNGTDYVNSTIVYRNNSRLSPVTQEDQGLMTLIPNAVLGNVYVAYKFDKRENTQKLSDGTFVNTNPVESDEQKIVTVDNTRILSCEDNGEYSATVKWMDNTSTKTVVASYQYLDSSYNIKSTTLYTFAYTDVSANSVMEVMVYDSDNDLYITEDDIIVQLNNGTMKVYGYKSGTTKTTATLKKYCKVVEHFTT